MPKLAGTKNPALPVAWIIASRMTASLNGIGWPKNFIAIQNSNAPTNQLKNDHQPHMKTRHGRP